jgi:hypothetical protein
MADDELTNEEAQHIAEAVIGVEKPLDDFDPVGDLVARVQAEDERKAAADKKAAEERRRRDAERINDRDREAEALAARVEARQRPVEDTTQDDAARIAVKADEGEGEA